MIVSIYIIAFIFSLIISLYFQKKIINYSLMNNIVDRTNSRKLDKSPRPRLGGIGIFTGFIVSIAIVIFISNKYAVGLSNKYNFNILNMLLLSLFLVFVIGLIDDFIGLNAFQKIPFEIIAATIVFFNGFSIKIVSLPISPYKVVLNNWVSYLITVIWIIGLTNALNLIDGIDGLAGSIAILSGFSFFFIDIINNKSDISIIILCMLGAIVGFLTYNLPPSKIYMGDSGSLTIGFFLAILSIKSSAKAAFGITFIVPIIILFIPIFDTLLAFSRRILKKKNPFSADKEHIHHKLMEKGYNEKQVLFILIGISFLFSVFGVLSMFISKNLRLIIFSLLFFIGIILIFYLKYISFHDFFNKITGFKKKNKKD